MDIVLASERDGVEAALEIRRRFGIPAVLASANHDDGNRARAVAADPAGWLPKPYSSERLLNTIRAIAASGDWRRSAGPDGAGAGRERPAPARSLSPAEGEAAKTPVTD